MNRFRITVAALIIVFVAALVYIEVGVENNRVIAENSTVEMWQSYTDKNGKAIEETDTEGEVTSSETPVLVTYNYDKMPEELQEQLLGEKIGATATYEQDLTQLAESSIDESVMPYQYTVTVNKVKVNHDYVEPVAEEDEDSSDEDSSDEDSSDEDSSDEDSSDEDSSDEDSSEE